MSMNESRRFFRWKGLLALALTAALLWAPALAQERVSFTTGLVGDGGDRLGRLDGLIIGIDAGHQAQANYEKEPVSPGSSATKAKVSSGTQGAVSKTPEHVVNLQVALKLKQALLREGASVVMARESADVDISNVERAQMMNQAGADLVLRLHCNGVDMASAHGMVMYVRKTGEKAQESDQAAHCLLTAMLAATGAQDRGVAHSDDYSGLNWSQVPSVLVEMGFLTNPQEEALLISDAYQDKLVQGMVEGIADYFGRQDQDAVAQAGEPAQAEPATGEAQAANAQAVGE